MTSNDHLVLIAKIASGEEYVPPKLIRFMLQSAARELLPHERVAQCLRAVVPTAQRVEIHKAHGTGHTHYRNLLVCGRIWHCPVCAAKISEERRKELSLVTHKWTGGLVLVTYTMSHHSSQTLSAVLSKLIDAYRFFKSGRAFGEITQYYGWVGSVRALEITHGKNGWHPHIHELVFTMNKLSETMLSQFDNNVSGRWRMSLKKFSEFASTERGVTVKSSNAEISDYVAKYGEATVGSRWTFAHELTKQVVKRGKVQGQSPTQLLMEYMAGDVWSGNLWSEYAHVLKGKHQLVWSRGTRKLLKLGEEQSDEKIAESLPQDSQLFASITRGQWYDILSNDYVGSLLLKAETTTEEEFEAHLREKLAQWSRS